MGYEEIEIKIAIPEHEGLLALCEKEFSKAMVNGGNNDQTDPDGGDIERNVADQDVLVYPRQALQILVNE